ncbi:MAG TPA: nucleotidyltransferase family protein [Smithella sp.]|nr:nucleotidyltransferase family protein [Smithella sp.]
MNRPEQNKKILSIIAALNSDERPFVNMSDLHDAEWPAMVEAIQKTGMAGYFYSLFSQMDAHGEIPATVIETLRKSARRVAAHNVFYESQCAALLKGLSAAGVDNIILKGMSYMQDIYGDTSARTMSDIDLLIHPDDRLKTLEFLMACGYSNYIIPSFQGTPEDFTDLTDLTGEAHFMKKTGALTVNIDLHWRLRARYPMNDYLALDSFPWWENSGTVMIGSVPAKRLSIEMQFIHLALHFAIHHQYTGLRWFIELGLFIRRFGNDLDWEFIYGAASSPDCRKLLGVCLRLIADYMGNSWTGSEVWRRFLPKSSMLPGEYRVYKNCLMREERSRLASYICMPLSPATLSGRLRLMSSFLFDSQGVILWHGSDTRVPKWLKPFYNLYIIGRQLLSVSRA